MLGFYAYPSGYPPLAETIKTAIEEINRSGLLKVESWEELGSGGTMLLPAVCEAIDKCDLFLCDLTHMNANVLFELGYAIARDKRVWISLDTSMEGAASNYRRIHPIATIIYAPYSNSYTLRSKLYTDRPFETPQKTIFREAIKPSLTSPQAPFLLYLKSAVSTEASTNLTRLIDRSSLRVLTDDPAEVTSHPLQWYGQHTATARAVIAHFLSDRHEGHPLHNSNYAFVCGLAHGFGKQLLMLAHEPFTTPLDCHDLLYTHSTAEECVTRGKNWLLTLETALGEYRDRQEQYVEAQAGVRRLRIGEYMAENESDTLQRYFVETEAVREALNGTQSLFVGRRGTGKTANLLMIASKLRENRRNHVCLLTPPDYELHGIMDILESIQPVSERSFLAESVWKFIIYSELARSLCESLEERRWALNTQELQFIDLINSPQMDLVLKPLAVRLERVARELQALRRIRGIEEERIRVSEILHETKIAELRTGLGKILKSRPRVAVLVDNLDKAWEGAKDLSAAAKFLAGLLVVANQVAMDLRRQSRYHESVNFSLMVFLRSDIFFRLLDFIREPDKIQVYEIRWEDPELLLQVLEKRFQAAFEGELHPAEIWKRYFCEAVKGMPVKQYFTERIMRRPRDIVYFCREALTRAVNRGHSQVEQEDILDAEVIYSRYALSAVVLEGKERVHNLQEVLEQFLGQPEVADKASIQRLLKKAGVEPSHLDEVLDALCDLGFLARQVGDDRFAWSDGERESRKYKVLARKRAERAPGEQEKFAVCRPFHVWLEIEASPGELAPQYTP